jgi:hypothetical protein
MKENKIGGSSSTHGELRNRYNILIGEPEIRAINNNQCAEN